MTAQLQIQVGLRGQVHEHMQRWVQAAHTKAIAGHEGTAANPNGIMGVASSGAGYMTFSAEAHVIWHKVQMWGCVVMLAHARWGQVTVGSLQGGEGGLMLPSPLFCVSGDMETCS